MTSLAMWTVYADHPDYPGKFVARRFDVDKDGPKLSASFIVHADLDALRDILEFELGLVKLTRSPDDNPKIVETWL
jgi:hypothetical protein